MEWLVRLSGDRDDLEVLSKVCKSQDLSINKEGDCFVLKSTEFNNLQNYSEVNDKADEILTLINGAAKIVLDSREPLRAEWVIEVGDDGKKCLHQILTAVVSIGGRLEWTVIKADGTVIEINQADPIPSWIQIAQKNKKVADVLRRLADENLDFETLYKIFEDVKGDVKKILDKWVGKKQVKRFTQTAQQYRHGKSGLKNWKPHPKPMEIHEAKTFIKTIVTNWIQEMKEV